MAKNVGHSETLANKPTQFLKHGALFVRLKIRLAAFHGAGDDASSHQSLELTLCRAEAKADNMDDLSLVEPLLCVADKEAQHGLARSAEQSRTCVIRVLPSHVPLIGTSVPRIGTHCQYRWFAAGPAMSFIHAPAMPRRRVQKCPASQFAAGPTWNLSEAPNRA